MATQGDDLAGLGGMEGEAVSGLSDGGAGDRDLLPAAGRTRMNGHHCGGHQADRVLGQGPDHFLAPLAEDQFRFALFLSHRGNPSQKG
jgi:hypothetical protein